MGGLAARRRREKLVLREGKNGWKLNSPVFRLVLSSCFCNFYLRQPNKLLCFPSQKVLNHPGGLKIEVKEGNLTRFWCLDERLKVCCFPLETMTVQFDHLSALCCSTHRTGRQYFEGEEEEAALNSSQSFLLPLLHLILPTLPTDDCCTQESLGVVHATRGRTRLAVSSWP